MARLGLGLLTLLLSPLALAAPEPDYGFAPSYEHYTQQAGYGDPRPNDPYYTHRRHHRQWRQRSSSCTASTTAPTPASSDYAVSSADLYNTYASTPTTVSSSYASQADSYSAMSSVISSAEISTYGVPSSPVQMSDYGAPSSSTQMLDYGLSSSFSELPAYAMSTSSSNAIAYPTPSSITTDSSDYASTTPTSSSSTTSPQQTSQPAPAQGSKRGLAYNDGSMCDAFIGSSMISWGYNWTPDRGNLSAEFEFVPMLWGPFNCDQWPQQAQAALDKGCTHMLAFNEPDLANGQEMTPQHAADEYRRVMQPFAGKARLGAPAVTNSPNTGAGLDWLKTWLGLTTDCTVDYVPIHWYNQADPSDPIENHIANLKEHIDEAVKVVGNKPLWVTEWGLTTTDPDQRLRFTKAALDYFDTHPHIERHSYFGVFAGQLMKASDGHQLDTLGQAWADYVPNSSS